MKTSKRLRLPILLICMAAALSACGGGDDDTSLASTPTTPTSPTSPTTPTHPTSPTTPTSPTSPSTPTTPTNPTNSTNPTTPTQPTTPTDPTARPNYTVGGTASGLPSDGIPLELIETITDVSNNKTSDTLSLQANGPFTFRVPAPKNSLYSVTISRQPSKATCQITNEAGKATANVSNLIVACISPASTVSTLAGSGSAGSSDGVGVAASFSTPVDVGVDANGNVYVSDRRNRRIRKITPDGAVTTLAGGTYREGNPDGKGAAASFYDPRGLTVDSKGNVYVADGPSIRKVTPDGEVTTIVNFIDLVSDPTRAFYADDVGLDSSGNLYVVGGWDPRLLKISPTGQVTTLTQFQITATDEHIFYPTSLALDSSGNIFVADWYYSRVLKVTPAGEWSVLAGLPKYKKGATDGVGAAAGFSNPEGIAVDLFGNVYVADTGNQKVRKIAPNGVVSTLAGSGATGPAGGLGTEASFSAPWGIAVDTNGSVYVAEAMGNKVRKITPR